MAASVNWKPVGDRPDDSYRHPNEVNYANQSRILLLGHFSNGCYSVSFGEYFYPSENSPGSYHAFNHYTSVSSRVTHWTEIDFADDDVFRR